MKQLVLIATLALSLSACAPMSQNISADDCGCPQNERLTLAQQKDRGISADECGCPQNDRETLVVVQGDEQTKAD